MEIHKKWLKQLKGHIARMVNEDQREIADQNFSLHLVCECIEGMLNKGLTMNSSPFNFTKPNYFDYIKEILMKSRYYQSRQYKKYIEAISECDKVETSLGRGRLLIRYSLKFCCLPEIVDLMKNDPLFAKYYTRDSILGCDLSYEIFMSLIKSLTIMKFNLKLETARFLDESWDIPDTRHLELVPCKSLGITVRYFKSHAHVLDVAKSSVAGEDDKIEIGDVIDVVCGITISKSKGSNLLQVLNSNKNKPLNIITCKCYFSNGDLYFPIISLLDQMNINVNQLRQKYALKQNSQGLKEEMTTILQKRNGARVIYCGNYECGTRGGVDGLEEAIPRALNKNEDKEVLIRLEEVGLCVLDFETDEVLFKYAYPEISACGRKTDLPLIFAFIAGDTTCNLATKFCCYVFRAKSAVMSKNIMLAIVEGFKRTNWTV